LRQGRILFDYAPGLPVYIDTVAGMTTAEPSVCEAGKKHAVQLTKVNHQPSHVLDVEERLG
jgi:hypothetical protein